MNARHQIISGVEIHTVISVCRIRFFSSLAKTKKYTDHGYDNNIHTLLIEKQEKKKIQTV